jgi:hypothetical protein
MAQRKTLGGLAALVVLGVAAIGVVALLVALLHSDEVSVPAGKLNPNDKTPLIEIEDKVITKFYLDLARQYQQLRNKLPDHGILREAMELIATEEILARNGHKITPEDVAEERDRQIRESRDRETLRKIQELLGPYPGMFEMILVRPPLANNRIHRLQQQPEFQKEAYRRAEEGLKAAQAEPEFYFRRMKDTNPDDYQRTDSRNPVMGRNPDSPQHHLPEVIEHARKRDLEFANRHLNKINPGEVCPEVVDGEGSFMVVRLIERSPEHAVFEVVSYRKVMYDVWFEGELKKLKGRVVDSGTRRLLEENLKDHVFTRWLFGN